MFLVSHISYSYIHPCDPKDALDVIQSQNPSVSRRQMSSVYNYWRMKRHMRRGQPLLRRLLAANSMLADPVGPIRKRSVHIRRVSGKAVIVVFGHIVLLSLVSGWISALCALCLYFYLQRS